MHKCGSWFDFIMSILENVLRFGRGVSMCFLTGAIACAFFKIMNMWDVDWATIRNTIVYSVVVYTILSLFIFFINNYFVNCRIAEAEKELNE